MALAMLIVDYVGGTYLVYLAVRAYPDHSVYALTTWGMLYLFGVVVPVRDAIRGYRWCRAQGIEMTSRAKAFVVAPIITGGLTLLAALDLLRRVTR